MERRKHLLYSASIVAPKTPSSKRCSKAAITIYDTRSRPRGLVGVCATPLSQARLAGVDFNRLQVSDTPTKLRKAEVDQRTFYRIVIVIKVRHRDCARSRLAPLMCTRRNLEGKITMRSVCSQVIQIMCALVTASERPPSNSWSARTILTVTRTLAR